MYRVTMVSHGNLGIDLGIYAVMIHNCYTMLHDDHHKLVPKRTRTSAPPLPSAALMRLAGAVMFWPGNPRPGTTLTCRPLNVDVLDKSM